MLRVPLLSVASHAFRLNDAHAHAVHASCRSCIGTALSSSGSRKPIIWPHHASVTIKCVREPCRSTVVSEAEGTRCATGRKRKVASSAPPRPLDRSIRYEPRSSVANGCAITCLFFDRMDCRRLTDGGARPWSVRHSPTWPARRRQPTAQREHVSRAGSMFSGSHIVGIEHRDISHASSASSWRKWRLRASCCGMRLSDTGSREIASCGRLGATFALVSGPESRDEGWKCDRAAMFSSA